MMTKQPTGLILATPAIWYPGIDETDWQDQLDAVIERSAVTSAFLAGVLEADVFLDYLAETCDDPLEIAEDWEEEIEICLSL